MKNNLNMKPEDTEAAEVCFGIELETFIPLNSAITVGNRHAGNPVHSGRDAETGEIITAPAFNGNAWRAERDGSIAPTPGHYGCEFVSPILKGDAGLHCLIDFVAFLNRIGAKVNKTCGCHVTVGIVSVTGTTDLKENARFVHKLTSLAKQNAWAIYAQTGTDRHTNHYAHQLAPTCANTLEEIERAARRGRDHDLRNLTLTCGRGMVNLQKAFMGDRSAIEFRAFAGTLNLNKILHHVATAIGLMRKAHVSPMRDFEKRPPIKNGTRALRRMWRVLGWAFSKRAPVAYGLFGKLYSEFNTYRKIAVEMATKFDERYPNANL